VNREVILRAAKVLLHDHLDGGVRATTLLEIVDDTDRAAAEEIVAHGAMTSGSLEEYLSVFPIVTRALQDEEHLRRVAYETGMDLRADNVIYAEIRFAPELHTHEGLDPVSVLRAVGAGFAESGLPFGLIVSSMRDTTNSERAIHAAIEARDTGVPVVGFDLAGPEHGHPASRHRTAIRRALDAGLGVTVHAGEGDGPASVRDAHSSGAQRIGHGVRITEEPGPDTIGETLLDAGIPLEICPSSNLHTGLYRTLAEHPVDRLLRQGHQVTINTDNRFVSRTTLSEELAAVAATFAWGHGELRTVLTNAAGAAFLPDADRAWLRAEILRRLGPENTAH
jgi:adenosine deaminase